MCSTSTSCNTCTLSDYEVLSEPKKGPGVVYTRVTPSRSIRNARHIYLGTHVGTYILPAVGTCIPGCIARCFMCWWTITCMKTVKCDLCVHVVCNILSGGNTLYIEA